MSFYRTCLKKDILILENGKEKNNISQKFVAASLPVRTVSAAVYAILLVGCLVSGGWSFLLFMAAASCLCLWEFIRILHLEGLTVKFLVWILHIVSIVGMASAWGYFPEVELSGAAWVVLLPFLFMLFAAELFRAKDDAVSQLGKAFLALVYVSVPFALSVAVPVIVSGGYDYRVILGVFVLIWSGDTFAYLFGISMGRHKLMERISPKKTVEGFLGGFISTLAVGYVLSLVFPGTMDTAHWMAVAGIVALFGVLGDLVESMFKRQAGIKDSGKIMPGHGGMLDRLDSFIMSMPFIYTYLYLFA